MTDTGREQYRQGAIQKSNKHISTKGCKHLFLNYMGSEPFAIKDTDTVQADIKRLEDIIILDAKAGAVATSYAMNKVLEDVCLKMFEDTGTLEIYCYNRESGMVANCNA